MLSTSARIRICCIWLVIAASAITCIALPVMGANSFFSTFKVTHSANVHSRLLAEQLAGPVFTLSISFSLLLAVMLRKRIAWWLWLVPLIGPVYTTKAVGGLSHDFSHAVFQECSEIYGSWISGACILAGVALVVIALLAFIDQRRLRRNTLVDETELSSG